MNYYIQGNAADAEKIKAAFEKLGYNTGNLGFTSSQLYYTIEGKVELMCTKSLQNLIKTHPDYKKLELPVEPKFKVGDWIITDKNHVWLVDEDCSTTGYLYRLIAPHGKVEVGEHEAVDAHSRLWTIEDSKDGDVLATDNGWTCIFKALDGWTFSSYCFMDSQNWFCEFGSEVHTPDSRLNGKIHPATKEQRDLLFAKMRESGYEWDADKKELNKIQPHYDIAKFKPKQWVLTRDTSEWDWELTMFAYLNSGGGSKFTCINGVTFKQCIPFNEDTKHLLGTTDMCDKCYINW